MAGDRSARGGVGLPRAQKSPPQASSPSKAGSSAGAERAEPAWARGRTRLALLRDLAVGEDIKTIAQILGVTQADVRKFSRDFSHEVDGVRVALAGKLASETAGLWAAQKKNRVAELQQSHEDLELVLSHLRAKGVDDGSGLGSRRHFNTLRGQIAVLAAIADEMEPRRGQPTQTDGQRPTRYVIDGLDPQKLI